MLVPPREERAGEKPVAQSGTSPASDEGRRWRTSDGSAVLEVTERAICGAGAVASAAEAEGLALSGLRAARLLSSAPPSAAPVSAWVLHKSGAPARFGAFALAAVDGQEAADHCLIAHLACALTGLAGECVVGSGLATRPWLWQPLSSAAIARALSGAEAEGSVADALKRAFEQVSQVTGRRHSALAVYRLDDAEVALVAAGENREPAVRIVDALRRQGVAAGLVGVVQLRPFPAVEIAALLRGKKSAVLLGADGDLAQELISALKHGADGRPVELKQARPELALVQQALDLERRTDTDPAARSIVIGVAPAGPRARELLYAASCRLGGLAPLSVWTAEAGFAIAALGVGSRVPLETDSPLDVAFIAHPSLLDSSMSLRKGATIVMAAEADAAEDVWRMLSPAQRELVTSRDLVLDWFDPRTGADVGAPTASWDVLVGALLEGASPLLASRLGLDEKGLRGMQAARLARVDARVAEAKRPAEVNFVPPRELPSLPKAAAEADPEWRGALRRFHMTGAGAAGAAALLPLAPAAATSLVKSEATSYPLVVFDGEPPEIAPLEQVLRNALDGLEDPATILPDHVRRLVMAFIRAVDDRSGSAALSEVVKEALESFEQQLSLSDKARKTVHRELRELTQALPAQARILNLGELAHLEMYAAVVLPARRRYRAELLADARRLRQQLLDMLSVDASHSAEAHSPEQVAASLGTLDFVDPSALSRAISKRPGPKRMADERRRRLQTAVDAMQRFLAKADEMPELVLVSARAVELPSWNVRAVVHDDPLGVAAGLFDGLAEQVTDVLRAIRVARLEVEARYNASLHDPVLSELDWRRLDAPELLLIPPVLAVESAENVWRSSEHALSSMLRSGRPIHVIVEESFGVGAKRQPPGLGYLLVAHHEALVVQTTLARPVHFTDSLRLVAEASRPAVTVVGPRPGAGPMPAWLRLAAAHEGRALPCFRYAPDRGLAWADSFDIDQNPAPAEVWPEHQIQAIGADGAPESIEERFTFAHAAALDLEHRPHFWLIPTEAWNEEQVPLAEYLETLLDADTPKVPFIWITDEQGNLARAVVSRELTLQCHERMRLWRILEELGGTRNAHADRAAEAARKAALEEAVAERAKLEEEHAAEVERVRNETATEALGRLAQALMDPNGVATLGASAPAPAPAAPAPTAPELRPEAEDAPVPAPVEEEEESVSFSEPFVDTVLCTTCNECTNLNPLMFKYNADKQAYLADPKAGTFLQLVTAAEKCPASCIHPGEPRKDDDTVTEDLVARAAKFN